jgi:hypothetical protein
MSCPDSEKDRCETHSKDDPVKSCEQRENLCGVIFVRVPEDGPEYPIHRTTTTTCTAVRRGTGISPSVKSFVVNYIILELGWAFCAV